MRHSGYRNTALALAEIIDNSVEAKAKHIEVLCVERLDSSGDRSEKRLEEIAIFDDGVGMESEELWNSLRMGVGTRQQAKGIGRFGMGLPNSSMSQCRKVTVYSWKSPNGILSTCLDLNENPNSDLSIKKPEESEVPVMWKKMSRYMKKSKSGTLVVWSSIDKMQWKRISTLKRNSEKIIGRTYRKFLDGNKLDISFITHNLDTNVTSEPIKILPNDPLYLTVPSSTPEPWDKRPMFEVDGDNLEDVVPIGNSEVIVRCTLATKEAREMKNGVNAGSLPHGKHANSNLGVSIIRANRELYTDTNLLQTYDPLERWWGVEVEFPNELDDLFGVSHSKQDAVNFSSMTQEIGKITRDEEGEDSSEIEDDTEDARNLRKLVTHIHARIKSMRRAIKKQNVHTVGRSGPKPAPDPWPDPDPGSTVTGKQASRMTDEEKMRAITEALSKIYEPDRASKEARDILKKKIKTQFVTASLESPYFFDVILKGGVTIITLNSDHAAYKHLKEIYEPIPEEKDKEVAERLSKIKAATNLLFVSWAHYENHTLKDDELVQLQEVRYEWSKRFRELVRNLDS